MGILDDDWFLCARLKLRHLQLLVAIDEQHNLHRAAAQLAMSQPAASKLLGDLENQLGVSLFERHARGLTPTWYGEVMTRHSHNMLAELRHAGHQLNALRAGYSGTVTAGTVMAPAVTLLTRAIERVHLHQPKLKISIEVDVSKHLIPRLLAGELDFTLSRIPADFSAAPFLFEEIGGEEICFVCRTAHPLLADEPLSLEAMTRYPWSLQPPGSLMRQRVDNLFLRHQLTAPAQIVDSADVLASLALVAQSETITVLIREVADLLCAASRFSVLPFSERLNVEPYGLVSLRHQRWSPGAKLLITELRELMAQGRAQDVLIRDL